MLRVEDLEQTPELLTLETDGNRWEPETKFQKAAATLALAWAAANPRRPQSRGGSGAEVQTLRVLKLSAIFVWGPQMEVWKRKSFRSFNSTSTPVFKTSTSGVLPFFSTNSRCFHGPFFVDKGCRVQCFCHLHPQDTFHAKNYPPPIQLACFPRVPCCKSLLLQSNLTISASFCIFPIYQIVEHGSGWSDIPIHC